MRKLIFFASFIGFFQVGSAAPLAWVVNFNTTMDVVNVPTNADIPNGSSVFQSEGLARSASGNLYITDNLGVIWDVTAGPIPVGPTGKTQIGDLDWNSNGLWGFSNTSSELFFYDFGLSAVTYAQAISGLGSNYITGVTYQNSTGDVFLAGNSGLNTDKLFRIPNAASAAQFVGSMAIGDANSFISDIDFDASGALYAMTWFHRWFYTVDPTTGATTFVSAGPHRDTTGMALNPVPEPATLAVLGLGSFLAARRRRLAPTTKS